MALATVTLDDKYALERGRIYLTGIQALVRLPIVQRQRDAAAGLNTAGFISGYRGSPVGGYDQQLWQAKRFLERNHIVFQPGINEDLAATSIWGTQQANLFKEAKYDGVFGIWYGKGPGVDRSGDVFKHGNNAGSSKHGGVLLVAGDDHAAKSSTLAHQSEHAFVDASIPVLHAAGVQEILDYGLLGIAMSRYAGCWVAFKTTAEVMDSSASVDIDPDRLGIALPEDFAMPEGGLNIRWPDHWLDQEARLHAHKLNAALAFARANRIDRVVMDSPNPRLGIITTGKSYLDVRQALDDLGIDDRLAAEIGIRLYKVGMPWPLEPQGIRGFVDGLEEILVVEEKRALIENQLKEQLYDLGLAKGPRVVGKHDEHGAWILPSNGELTPGQIARVIAARIERYFTSNAIRERMKFLEAKERQLTQPETGFKRTPYFCSGCPHNTSTRVPDGSRAAAGIGCHFMSVWMDRNTETFTHMGGEGATWIGQSHFVDTKHIFVNLGDGTYTHSGLLAIRAAAASGVSMTYKILYNDAVAMTGGQPADGAFTVPQIAAQVAAEGVRQVRIVTEDPDKYPIGTAWPEGAKIHHRDDLDAVQRELREADGVTVLLYDQTCAAEKRRRRKRNLMVDPPKRIFINEQVCEGCGDCGVASNCVSVVPVETEYGRKRAIDQSNCNKDYSCVKGFCPSFVNVIGGKVRKSRAAAEAKPDLFPVLPEPETPKVDRPYGILVTGIGGTGVVTIGALLGMAAHIEGKGASVLDMTGLAQKGGAVLSHIRIAATPDDLHAVRIAAGSARLLLACDMAAAAGFEGLSKVSRGETVAVVNSHEAMTGDFTRAPDMQFPAEAFRRAIAAETGENSAHFVDATRIATRLLGDSIAANLFMLGYAFQKGLIPVSGAAIEQAIELNAVAVPFNKQAFLWGRRAAHDFAAVETLAEPPTPKPLHRAVSQSFEELVERRVDQLTAYQDKAYAARYRALVAKAEAAEDKCTPGRHGVAAAVARYAFKLMAYKDEYEVARLYSDGTFMRQLNEQFEGDYKLEINLAPPLFSERDPETGRLKKRVYGRWMLSAMSVLASLKGLRGTAFDIFGRTEERRQERRLIEDYVALVAQVCDGLTAENHAIAVDLLSVPEQIRGYGHVKQEHLARARSREAQLLEAFRDPEAARTAAE
jgi:indolepyruvate ferredoxin oxidoreductase